MNSIMELNKKLQKFNLAITMIWIVTLVRCIKYFNKLPKSKILKKSIIILQTQTFI